ncbi:MAG: DnaJ domain-containing protein [Candidatus Nitrosotenuis sp.]
MDSGQAYLILNLKPNASNNEIKQAYRKLALESHPDRNDSEQDGKKFKLITEAYNTLKGNKSTTKSAQKNNTNSKNDQNTQTNWGARSKGKVPEQDWSKFTEETEQADPNFWQEYVNEFWKGYESKKSKQSKDPFDFEITQEKKPNLFSSVDHSLCIGCCSCEIIAPEVFHIDKKTKMNPKSNVIKQNGASSEKIMDAAKTCPTKAIYVEDVNSKKRLYPY